MNLCAFLVCLSLSAADPPRDRWLAEDKWKHFFASFVVTSLSASAARVAGAGPDGSVVIGAAVGTGTGIWKEVRDVRHGNRASVGDLLWDLGGVGAAAAALSQAR